MGATPYLYERQTEYWTSRGIEDYFLDAGFDVVTVPMSQMAEHEVPFDFVFLEKTTSKMFGLQYKALYHNGHDFWPLNEAQHRRIQAFREWGFYCLSEVKSVDEHRIALHRALFVPVSLDYSSEVPTGRLDFMYYRWGGFVNGLERCTVGRRVMNRQEVENALRPVDRNYIDELDRRLVDLFVANLESKRLLHLDNRG